MASLIPLISTGIAAAGLFQSHRQNRAAEKAGKQTRAESAKLQAEQSKKQNAMEFEERKKLGARRRIAGMNAEGSSGTLFSGTGFGGVPSQATLG